MSPSASFSADVRRNRRPAWPQISLESAAALLQADPGARAASFPEGYVSVMGLGWLSALSWAAIESGECVPDLGFEEHAREWDDLEGTSTASVASDERGAFVGF